MKTTKRLAIEIRHREVTITVDGSTLHVQHSEPDAADTTICRICNSAWINLAARSDGDTPASVDSIRYALESFGLHMQVSPAGRLRICQKSFEAFKEKL